MENKEHPAVSPDVHPPLRQAAKFHGRTELCFWMSSSVRGWESKPRYLQLSESSFPSEPTHRVAWRSHRGRGDHDPPGEAVQHLSHSASGEAKWITKLPTEKIAHFCHSYKRKKKKDTNINGLKTPVGRGIRLIPLSLSLLVPLSQEKPDLANCHAVLFKTKRSIKSPTPLTWNLDALRERTAEAHLRPPSGSGEG